MNNLEFLAILWIIVIIIFVIVIAIYIGISIYNFATNEETITTETVEMKITHFDIDASSYYVLAANDTMSAAIKITREEFATLKEGDMITVEITETHNTKFSDHIEYRLGRK